MKYRLLAAVLFSAALAAPVAAQEGRPDPEYPFQKWRTQILKGVTLTERQTRQVDSIARQTWLQMRALQGKLQYATQKEKDAELSRLQFKQADDIEGILAADQRSVLRKNVEDWKKRTAPPR